MNKATILNTAIAATSIALIYILIFEEAAGNELMWGALALFFILIILRQRSGKSNEVGK